MSYWTDAHCHLQDRFLADDQVAHSALATLERAFSAVVNRVVVIGTDAATSGDALAIT